MTLEKLCLYGNNIGSDGCRALTRAMAVNKTLKLVEFLPGNAADAKDVEMLAKIVRRNRK